VSVEYPVMAEHLDLNETEDGMVIFDGATDRVHHLNNTAAIVLQWCDGTHTPAQIADLVGSAFVLAEPPIAETEDCLSHLRREGLVH
jgi:hypothetical protein